MSTEKEKKDTSPVEDTAPVEESAAEESKETAPVEEEPKKEKKSKPKKEKDKESKKAPDLKEAAEKLVREEKDRYLRLAAEYDNFRKRAVKEKDAAYGNGKADAVAKLHPIYDNLERALNQPTEDAAFKKGVEIFGQAGDSCDPSLHNAVMHTEDESRGENVIAQVFQKGFKIGEKVVRFAMVQVAN